MTESENQVKIARVGEGLSFGHDGDSDRRVTRCGPCWATHDGPRPGAADIDPPDTIRVTIGRGLPGADARALLTQMTDRAYDAYLAELDTKEA